MLLGTAGHVDHGKTSLVAALTGVHCDRLEAERRRGITIELGFARLDLPDGRRVSVVDVPGHEKLVRTMLVGAGGMDAVLLAVAADAGVMPQTREHLAACAVLGVRRGVVAVTCVDRVADPAAAVARVRAELRGTALADAECVPVCAPLGQGLPALGAAIARLVDDWRPPPPDAPALMPVDRVFTVGGFGTVVTGALIRGRLEVGATVALVPGTEGARVRGLEVHGEPVSEASAGQRVAVNLVMDRAEAGRGAVLAAPGTVRPGRIFDAEVEWCAHAEAPLTRARGLSVHLGATRALADVRADAPVAPGQRGLARLRLDRALPLPPGGRFVLRGPVDLRHGGVIGGGRILDAHPPRRRPGAVRQALAAVAPAEAIAVLVTEAGPRGLDPAGLATRLPIGLPPTGPRMFAPAVLAAAAAALREEVAAWHAAHPESPGLAAAPVLADPLRRAALAASDAVVRQGQILRLPEHRAALDPADAALAGKLMRAIGRAGLDALGEAALEARFPKAAQGQVQRVVRHLERVGRVVRHREAVFPGREARALRRQVARRVEAGPMDVAAFKALSGLTRRRAIPLLEWLDGEGVTRRAGEVRVAGPKARDFAAEEE